MLKRDRPGVVWHRRVVQKPTLISLIAQIPQRDFLNLPSRCRGTGSPRARTLRLVASGSSRKPPEEPEEVVLAV